MAANDFVLQAALREESGKGPAHRLRAQGRVPAVVYSHGKQGVCLSLAYGDLASIIHHTGLVSIKVDKKRKPITAIIKDYQWDVLRGHLMHVDFQEVLADEVITVAVPLHQHGTPAGESHGGIIDQQLHELEIRCPANQMPESIEVDISGLDLEAAITAGDIPLPDSVELVSEAEEVVFSMYLPREAEEAEAEEEALPEEGEDGGEPEVIGKGRQDQEQEEASE